VVRRGKEYQDRRREVLNRHLLREQERRAHVLYLIRKKQERREKMMRLRALQR
jgi:hypothetical protein